MIGLRIAAGVAFLLAGLLELLFLALSLLGTIMGGVMTVATFAGELRNEEAVIGPVILLFYGLWLVATLIAGPLHIAAGVSLVSGRRQPRLLWAGIGASIFPVATIYCAPTSILAGALGLVVMLVPGAFDAPESDRG